MNNHISTIEEDFEGENMTSEFSTQRTQNKDHRNGGAGNITDRAVTLASQKSGTDGDKKETPLPRHLDDIAGGQDADGRNP